MGGQIGAVAASGRALRCLKVKGAYADARCAVTLRPHLRRVLTQNQVNEAFLCQRCARQPVRRSE